MIIIIILCTYILTVDVLCSNTPSKMNMDKFALKPYTCLRTIARRRYNHISWSLRLIVQVEVTMLKSSSHSDCTLECN